jgi:cardiolipin synthase
MRKWLSPPNLVTLIRLVLTPFLLAAILRRQHFRALVIFAAAAATDAVDGALARGFGWSTPVGAYLDPIADKVLLSGVYLALALTGDIPIWLVGVIFGRDLMILAGSGVVLLCTRLRRFPPSAWGKACTFVQILTAVAWMARNVTHSGVVETLARALLWPTAAITLWSGIHYGWREFRLLRTD